MSTWGALVWAGRGLFVAAPFAVVGCRLTRPIWGQAPLEAGVPGHWIPSTALALCLVWAMFLPFLVLPIAPLPLVSTNRSEVFGETVLGTRRVTLRALKPLRSWYFPDRGTYSFAHLVRDGDGRWFIAWDSQLWGGRVGPRALQSAIDRVRGKRVTVVDWVRGLALPFLWGGCALVIFALGYFSAVGIR